MKKQKTLRIDQMEPNVPITGKEHLTLRAVTLLAKEVEYAWMDAVNGKMPVLTYWCPGVRPHDCRTEPVKGFFYPTNNGFDFQTVGECNTRELKSQLQCVSMRERTSIRRRLEKQEELCKRKLLQAVVDASITVLQPMLAKDPKSVNGSASIIVDMDDRTKKLLEKYCSAVKIWAMYTSEEIFEKTSKIVEKDMKKKTKK